MEPDRDISHLHPDVQRRLKLVFDDMAALGTPVFEVEGLRPDCRQEALFRQGRAFINGIWQVVDRKLVVTNAPFGRGNHRYGIASDLAFKGNEPYAETHPWEKLAEIAKKHGFESGYDWPKPKQDKPHVQRLYGLSNEDLRRLFAEGGLCSVWRRIDEIVLSYS